MALCEKCGGKLSFFGKCEPCDQAEQQEITEKRLLAEKQNAELKRQATLAAKEKEKIISAAIKAVVLTTEACASFTITNRHKIVMSSVDCAFDVKVPKAEVELLDDLRKQAVDLGANAVVAIDFKFIETYSANIGAGDFKKFKMVAFGTAVDAEF